MGVISIKKGSITEFDTDAIVNAANSRLAPGGGVCGAIFSAAGFNELDDACMKIGACKTGDAVITDGFKLKAKHIIHAVGPIWRGGNSDESRLLYSAYFNALKVAKENNCKTIAFPLISAGIYGYPLLEAWNVALKACADFLIEDGADINIYFAVLDQRIIDAGIGQMQEFSKENKYHGLFAF